MTAKGAFDALTSNVVRTLLAGSALSLLVWMVTKAELIDVLGNKIDNLTDVVQAHDAAVDQQIGQIITEQSGMKQLEARLEQRMDDAPSQPYVAPRSQSAPEIDPPIIGPVIRAIIGPPHHVPSMLRERAHSNR